jgi:hypothetical protein
VPAPNVAGVFPAAIAREGGSVDVRPTAPTTLRPLGVGELLDRAVTLTVRNFWALAALNVAFVALIEVIQYLGGDDRAHLVTAMTQVLQNQAAGKSSSDVFKTLSDYQSAGSWTIVAFAVTFFFLPLPTAAMATAAGAFYFGRTLGFAGAYRAAVRVWLPSLLLIVTYGVAGACAYLGVILVVVALALVIGLVSVASKALGIVLGVLLAVVFVPLALLGAVLVGLAYQVSFCTVVLEGANFWDGFLAGFRRVFRGVGLRRSLLVGLAYFAVFFGIFVVSAVGQGVLLGLVKSNVLGSIFAVVINVAAGAFATVFLVLFYYDLRVREEGLDLQAAAFALPADPSPAN